MQKLKIASCVLCLVTVSLSIATYAYACGGFNFLLYQQNTRAWDIDLGTTYLQEPRIIKITAQSNGKKDERITYNIEICGPKGFRNKDIAVLWQDSDGKSFTIGKGGSQSFKGITTLRWQSGVIIFKGNHKNNIALILTFQVTAGLGKYNANVWMEYC